MPPSERPRPRRQDRLFPASHRPRHLQHHPTPGVVPRVGRRAPRRRHGPSPGVVHHRPPPPGEHPLGRARLPPRCALGRLLPLPRPLLHALGPVVLDDAAPARRRAGLPRAPRRHAGLPLALRLAARVPGEGLPSVRAHLSAALTNKATCLDGLAGASGPRMDGLLASLDDAYEHVSNSLSLVARRGGGGSAASFQATVAKIIHHNRRLLQDDEDSDGDDDDSSRNDNDDDNSRNDNEDSGNSDGNNGSGDTVITVAKDGSGNVRTVGEAVAAAPNNSEARTVIQVKAGTYVENVEVPPYKTNIALVGEGRDVTVITGSRSAADGWTTFRTATVGVSGEGFLARDIAFRNTAGAARGQAVALRVNADMAAAYRCAVDGHQDALYAHSFRQFYRECALSGTVDLAFGNAAAVLQACALVAGAPVPGQSNVLTAQSRGDPNQDTGFAVHNCTVEASPELLASGVGTRTFLGRPWGAYARAVVIESFLGPLVDRDGWTGWPGAEPGRADTVYFGEYANEGAGAGTGARVGWAGFHEMDYDEAAQFAVDKFIYGDDWLAATSFPYDQGI
ncbi:unnamed protein product [Triticum turgidum subsp. durum]|uniref:pectinesterase n=1 Tax=Triticum turgidum subsp. durum TaxID=4567 RepID=A0A9R0Z710_TRITD|nr:unnamed protein product [Triticum turgidum subsp. durum]